jgi:hypothetical protein
LTPEQQDEYIKNKRNEYAKNIYKNMTPEEKTEYKKKQNEYVKNRYKNMTPEEKTEYNKKQREYQINKKKNMTPEEKTEYNKKQIEYQKTKKDKMTNEDIEERRKKNNKRYKELYRLRKNGAPSVRIEEEYEVDSEEVVEEEPEENSDLIICVFRVEYEGVQYYVDANSDVYDINSEKVIGKYVDNIVVLDKEEDELVEAGNEVKLVHSLEIGKETKKEQKDAEKLAEKERKDAEKLAEKERKDAEKLAEKLAEKERKDAEKLAEKERKDAEKERIKIEKEAAKRAEKAIKPEPEQEDLVKSADKQPLALTQNRVTKTYQKQIQVHQKEGVDYKIVPRDARLKEDGTKLEKYSYKGYDEKYFPKGLILVLNSSGTKVEVIHNGDGTYLLKDSDNKIVFNSLMDASKYHQQLSGAKTARLPYYNFKTISGQSIKRVDLYPLLLEAQQEQEPEPEQEAQPEPEPEPEQEAQPEPRKNLTSKLLSKLTEIINIELENCYSDEDIDNQLDNVDEIINGLMKLKVTKEQIKKDKIVRLRNEYRELHIVPIRERALETIRMCDFEEQRLQNGEFDEQFID